MTSRPLAIVESFNDLTTSRKLLIIICFGFVLRLYVTLAAVTIATDSINYINIAKEFTGGNYYGIFNMHRPPLYPLLLSLVSYITADYELAGRLVSLAFGTLVIPIAFCLGRLVYNERVGILTAFFVAIHPYLVRYSGEALTEGLYYFLAASVTFVGLKAIRDKSLRLMLLTGLLGVLIYLTKPGGIGFLMIITLLIIVSDIRAPLKIWVKKIAMVISAWVVFLVLALPYLTYLAVEKGEVIMTGRGGAADVMATSVNIVTTGLYLDKFVSALPEAYTYPFFLLFLFFLWRIPRRIGRRDFSAIELSFFFIQVFYYGIYMVAAAHRRYIVQLMPLGMVLSAVGFIYISDYFKKRKKESVAIIMALLVVFLIAFQLPKGLKRLKAHHLPEKQAGQWFLKNKSAGRLIFTKTPIMPYYGEGLYLGLPGGVDTLKGAVTYGKANGVLYMAGYTRKLRQIYSDFDATQDEFLVKEQSFYGKKDGEFVIYSMCAGAGSTESNLISNGSFSSDTTGWSVNNATIASVSGGVCGKHLEITRVEGTSQNAMQILSGITIGRAYRITANVRSGTSGDEPADLLVYNNGRWVSKTLVSSGGWMQFDDVEFVAAARVVSIYLRKRSATPGTMLFSNVLVQEVEYTNK